MGPEQALQAHRDLGGKVMVPIHWGLFDLAVHSWTEPAERLLAAMATAEHEAAADGGGGGGGGGARVALALPLPGQTVRPATVTAGAGRWWPSIPWSTADETPIVSTGQSIVGRN